jgi:hypothetical protein
MAADLLRGTQVSAGFLRKPKMLMPGPRQRNESSRIS